MRVWSAGREPQKARKERSSDAKKKGRESERARARDTLESEGSSISLAGPNAGSNSSCRLPALRTWFHVYGRVSFINLFIYLFFQRGCNLLGRPERRLERRLPDLRTWFHGKTRLFYCFFLLIWCVSFEGCISCVQAASLAHLVSWAQIVSFFGLFV